MKKSRNAYRTISEVEALLGVPPHVLRYWESQFEQVQPVKRAGNRRYYRPSDIELIAGLRKLLHDDGLTIRGANKVLREKGVQHVASLVPSPLDGLGLDGEASASPEGGQLKPPLDAAAALEPTAVHPSVSAKVSAFGMEFQMSASAVRKLDLEGRRALIRCHDRLASIRDRLADGQSPLRLRSEA